MDKAEQNTRIEREEYYVKRVTENEKNARRYYLSAIKKVPKLLEIRQELKKLNLDLCRALLYCDSIFQVDSVGRIAKLEEEYKSILNENKLCDEKMKPNYYVKCKDCNDTGYKKDSSLCDCFKFLNHSTY